MIMMMGLIITMRTSDNGTLNCICHHMTQAVTCFSILQDVCALRGATFSLNDGLDGKEMSKEDKYGVGRMATLSLRCYLLALGYHQENN